MEIKKAEMRRLKQSLAAAQKGRVAYIKDLGVMIRLLTGEM